ncbi:hypothetical protein OH738_10735 [Streptomyces hirsutus]|uniref:Uncharacterized protein n=1 Tax=Streptomyces hirsutus TaxID=35620 RepID=A0ABZ1GTU1_9ACTN|nr:hypothetical protein [Streptomyces hirsutus]WSD09335.1 hypothetical protein OIE73_28740 [Streptomyces hirsutus]WTD17215.1 hypothetical protein OH738_10735 [Streptomyces hirsutus]
MAHDDAAVTMADLFDPEPEQWGLRGDPYAWRALRDHLSGSEIPTSADEVLGLLRAAFSEVVGIDLVTERETQVYREQYAHGGMSSGYICLPTWRDQLMPLLVKRAWTLLVA